MALNCDNTILIFSTINSKINNDRTINLINRISKFNIPVMINYGILYEPNARINQKANLLNKNMINIFNKFRKVDYEYAIIAQDDFEPIDNFLEELNNTIESLPNDWRTLHFCPGFLWGRKFFTYVKGKIKVNGKLDPEDPIDDLESSKCDRYFIIGENKDLWIKKGIWLGGPLAFILKKEYLDEYDNDFRKFWSKVATYDDKIILNIATKNDYVCKNPLLGIENDQGSTSIPNNGALKL